MWRFLIKNIENIALTVIISLNLSLVKIEINHKSIFGKPTSDGIDYYVNANQDKFIKDFIDLVQDSIYNDIYFGTLNFKKITPKKDYNPDVLGIIIPHEYAGAEIIINNEENFSDFEYNEENSHKYDQGNYFVKATVFHEMMHYYFNQCTMESEILDSVEVNKYYKNNRIDNPTTELLFGAKFIEEGICEYFIQHYKLCPELQQWLIPQSELELKNVFFRYDLFYGYASQYIKDFMDYQILKYHKIKYPIFLIIRNQPPTYDEILHPQQYFDRLM